MARENPGGRDIPAGARRAAGSDGTCSVLALFASEETVDFQNMLADLFQDAAAVREAKADFDQRMKGRKYTTRIPEGQKAPKTIR